MTDRPSILTIAHGHPDLIRGGGEIAAHAAHRAYRASDRVGDAWFLAGTEGPAGATGRIRRYAPGEYLWQQGIGNAFFMRAANIAEVAGYYAELLRALSPDVIHAHHYFNLGLEFLKVTKDTLPDARIVLTLHEYIAICPNAGLMTDPVTGELCSSGRYETHLRCAPDRSREELWLRKRRFDAFFAHVDHFVAPSEFLRARYIEWGIAPERISFIPNGQPDWAPLPPRPLACGESRARFGFFGQLAAHKGLDVVLSALALLPEKTRRKITLEINGANLARQSAAFRDRLRFLAHPLLESGTAIWNNAYTARDLPARLAGIDWVLVPSVWYENAPLVIQEAFGNARPVIVSDLGGMREAVADGAGGLRAAPGNPRAWADTLAQAAMATSEWDRLRDRIPAPPRLAEVTDQHLDLFRNLERVTA